MTTQLRPHSKRECSQNLHHEGKMKRFENILLFLLTLNRMFGRVCICCKGPRGGRGLTWTFLRAPWGPDPLMLCVEVCMWWLGTFFRGKRTETLVTHEGI